MEVKKVNCTYDGSRYSDIPGGTHHASVCPCCGAVSPNPHDEWTKIEYPHQEIERTFLTDEEAVEILKKYVKKYWVNGNKGYSSNAGKDILEYAWYSQHWPTYAINPNIYAHRNVQDWMGDDLKLSFQWYLDGVGRDLGYGRGRSKGTFEKGFVEKLEKDLNEMAKELSRIKYEKERETRDKRENKLQEEGEAILKTLNIGDVVLVKFNDVWKYRGMQVLEIEDGYISGFYLDNQVKIVDGDYIEKEGFFYTKPSNYTNVKVNNEWVPGKLEWDGKTFIKTRTYETKMSKFIKQKVENPIIIKK